MTDPDEPSCVDDLSDLRLMIEKMRKVNSYWDWPDKPVKELGIARDILPRAFKDVVDLRSREQGQDPPDCECSLDGRFSGVEVTELLDQETLERSIRGDRVYLEWDRQQFLSALQSRIDDKDKPWKGDPYERRVLVIHTDECTLDRETVHRFLQGSTFTTKLITNVVLGLSYHSGTGDAPVFQLILAGTS
jgi:hypothetical protein